MTSCIFVFATGNSAGRSSEPRDTFKGFYLIFFIMMTILLSAVPCLSWTSGHRDFAKSLMISIGCFAWISFWMIYGKIQYQQFIAAKVQFEEDRARLENELEKLRANLAKD